MHNLCVYIFNRTGSAAQMALVTLLGFLPTLLLSAPAGVLADLFDRRILMMIGDGCSAIGIGYILICMNTGETALWQICVGVFVSSCFSALLEPVFKATITDLLTKEEYTKANGLTSLVNSARHLVSPVLAGLLLSAYAGSKTMGMTETVCSLGMLATALITGITGIRKKHADVLGVSLALAGVFMVIFALKENIVLICASGFLFFAMLPLANSSLDYLARINIPDELQGRAWGFIGLLSQLGYIPAFAFAGVLADRAAGTMKHPEGSEIWRAALNWKQTDMNTVKRCKTHKIIYIRIDK